jgi:1,4-dihydroxy-2-naphthoyl-CoA hydrolase
MAENSIWFTPPDINELNALGKGTLGESLGIRITEVGPSHLAATMPVDHRTIQPFGLLGSIASLLVVNRELFIGVGVEINANHLKAVLSGHVKGICTPLSISGKNHVWDIKIYNEAGELTCISRFTCTIVQRSRFGL